MIVDAGEKVMEMSASTVYGYVDGVGRDGEKGGHQVGKKTVDLGGIDGRKGKDWIWRERPSAGLVLRLRGRGRVNGGDLD